MQQTLKIISQIYEIRKIDDSTATIRYVCSIKPLIDNIEISGLLFYNDFVDKFFIFSPTYKDNSIDDIRSKFMYTDNIVPHNVVKHFADVNNRIIKLDLKVGGNIISIIKV